MHPALESKDSIRGRWISSPTFENGKLFFPLPEILDGINARLLRKLVLGRMAETRHLRFDARHLTRLGRIGAATLWQVMGIAEKHGIYVEMVRVKANIYKRLNTHKDAEAKRQSHYGSPTSMIHIFVEDNEHLTKTSVTSTKTLRLRRQFHSQRVRAVPPQPGKRKKRDSWTGKVIKLFQSGRNEKAA